MLTALRTSTLLAVVLVVVSGCGGTRTGVGNDASADVQTPGTAQPATTRPSDPEPVSPQPSANREAALSRFIAGSIEESKGNHEAAIIEYTRALELDDDASIHYALAKNYLEIDKPAPALRYARNAVARAPKDVEYTSLLAVVYATLRMPDSAATVFEQVLRLSPDNLSAQYALAHLYALASRADEALDMCDRMFEQAGNDPELLSFALGVALDHNLGTRARGYAETLHATDPDEWTTAATLADICLQQGDTARARALYRDQAARHPDATEAVQSASRFFISTGDWRSADTVLLRYFRGDSLEAEAASLTYSMTYPYMDDAEAEPAAERAAALLHQRFPERTDLTLSLAWQRFRLEQYDSVITAARSVIAREPLNAWAHHLLARAFLTQDMYEEAIAPLQSLVDLGKATAEVWSWLGFALGRLGAGERADEALRHALALDPLRMDALSTLALSHDNRQEYARSDSLYEQALALYEAGTIEKDASYYLICNNFAYTLAERRRDLDRAQQLARAAVEQEPENSSYLDTIGWIHFRRGEYDSALARTREAIAVRMRNGDGIGPVLYDHLGDILHAMGRAAEAGDAWRAALREDPTLIPIQEKLHRTRP